MEKELADFCIVSQTKLVEGTESAPENAVSDDEGNVKVTVSVCELEKCERCWKRTPDVDSTRLIRTYAHAAPTSSQKPAKLENNKHRTTKKTRKGLLRGGEQGKYSSFQPKAGWHVFLGCKPAVWF